MSQPSLPSPGPKTAECGICPDNDDIHFSTPPTSPPLLSPPQPSSPVPYAPHQPLPTHLQVNSATCTKGSPSVSETGLKPDLPNLTHLNSQQTKQSYDIDEKRFSPTQPSNSDHQKWLHLPSTRYDNVNTITDYTRNTSEVRRQGKPYSNNNNNTSNKCTDDESIDEETCDVLVTPPARINHNIKPSLPGTARCFTDYYCNNNSSQHVDFSSELDIDLSGHFDACSVSCRGSQSLDERLNQQVQFHTISSDSLWLLVDSSDPPSHYSNTREVINDRKCDVINDRKCEEFIDYFCVKSESIDESFSRFDTHNPNTWARFSASCPDLSNTNEFAYLRRSKIKFQTGLYCGNFYNWRANKGIFPDNTLIRSVDREFVNIIPRASHVEQSFLRPEGHVREIVRTWDCSEATGDATDLRDSLELVKQGRQSLRAMQRSSSAGRSIDSSDNSSPERAKPPQKRLSRTGSLNTHGKDPLAGNRRPRPKADKDNKSLDFKFESTLRQSSRTKATKEPTKQANDQSSIITPKPQRKSGLPQHRRIIPSTRQAQQHQSMKGQYLNGSSNNVKVNNQNNLNNNKGRDGAKKTQIARRLPSIDLISKSAPPPVSSKPDIKMPKMKSQALSVDSGVAEISNRDTAPLSSDSSAAEYTRVLKLVRSSTLDDSNSDDYFMKPSDIRLNRGVWEEVKSEEGQDQTTDTLTLSPSDSVLSAPSNNISPRMGVRAVEMKECYGSAKALNSQPPDHSGDVETAATFKDGQLESDTNFKSFAIIKFDKQMNGHGDDNFATNGVEGELKPTVVGPVCNGNTITTITSGSSDGEDAQDVHSSLDSVHNGITNGQHDEIINPFFVSDMTVSTYSNKSDGDAFPEGTKVCPQSPTKSNSEPLLRHPDEYMDLGLNNVTPSGDRTRAAYINGKGSSPHAQLSVSADFLLSPSDSVTPKRSVTLTPSDANSSGSSTTSTTLPSGIPWSRDTITSRKRYEIAHWDHDHFMGAVDPRASAERQRRSIKKNTFHIQNGEKPQRVTKKDAFLLQSMETSVNGDGGCKGEHSHHHHYHHHGGCGREHDHCHGIGDSYLTPRQRLEKETRFLKREVARLQRENEQKVAELFALQCCLQGQNGEEEQTIQEDQKDGQIMQLTEKLGRNEKERFVEREELCRAQEELSDLEEKYASLQLEMVEQRAKYDEYLLGMYRKGQEAARFEREQELDYMLANKDKADKASVSLTELSRKLSRTEGELARWQALRLAESYKGIANGETNQLPAYTARDNHLSLLSPCGPSEADVTLCFVRDAFLHFLTDPIDTEQHLRALLKIFAYPQASLDRIRGGLRSFKNIKTKRVFADAKF